MRTIFYAFTINTLFNNHLQLHILFLLYYSQSAVVLHQCRNVQHAHSIYLASFTPPNQLSIICSTETVWGVFQSSNLVGLGFIRVVLGLINFTVRETVHLVVCTILTNRVRALKHFGMALGKSLFSYKAVGCLKSRTA